MSPLRRSARAGAKQADDAAATAAASPPAMPALHASPSKAVDRKRKRSSLAEEAQKPRPHPQPSPKTNGTSAAAAEPDPTTSTTAKANGSGDSQVVGSPLQHNGSQPSMSVPKAAAPVEAARPAETLDAPSEADEYRALLGIGAGASDQEARKAKGHPDTDRLELKLLEPDAAKLNAVLSSLAPEILDSKRPSKDRQANGTDKKARPSQQTVRLPFATLREAFKQGTRLRDVREHLLSLRSPLLDDAKLIRQLATEPWSNAKTHVQKDELDEKRSRLCTLTLILSLVDQLARRYRETEQQGASAKGDVLASLVEMRAEALEERNKQVKSEGQVKIKAEPATNGVQAFLESGRVAGKYALHMRLPRGDFFSKSAYLDHETLEKLDAGQADLVAIAPDIKTTKREADKHVPTLGERSNTTSRIARKHQTTSSVELHFGGSDALKPVTYLRYGNYASFAPTHDSAGATMSHTASARLWAVKTRARAAELAIWGPRAYQDEALRNSDSERRGIVSEPPRLESTVTQGFDAHPGLNIDLTGLDESLDPDAIKAALVQLERDEKISAQLQRNLILLRKLQEFQWERLRRSYMPKAARATSSAAKASRKEAMAAAAAGNELEPSSEEGAVAAALLDSLASLIALEPQAADPSSGARLSVLPDRATIANFSHTIGAIDPALSGGGESGQSGYWGTLDETLYALGSRSSRGRAGHGEFGGGIANMAAGAPLLIRSNRTVRLTEESESKASRNVASLGVARDSGKGMLERFASSRLYSEREDRHEAELAALGMQAQANPRRPASPMKAPSGSGLQHTRSGGPQSAASPSAQHGSASPAMQNYGQQRNSLPPPHPQQPHPYNRQQQQQQPPQHQVSPASSPNTPARYPPGTPSSYPHASNGVARPPPQQQQQMSLHQPNAGGAQGYGSLSGPSASPGPAPEGMSYAFTPSARPYNFNPNASLPPAMLGAQGSPHLSSYPVKMPYSGASSPAKSYAYPSPAPPGPGGGGYSAPSHDWHYQQQQQQQGQVQPPNQQVGGQFYGHAQGHAMPLQHQQQLDHHRQQNPQQQQQHPHPHHQQHAQHPQQQQAAFASPGGYPQYAMR